MAAAHGVNLSGFDPEASLESRIASAISGGNGASELKSAASEAVGIATHEIHANNTHADRIVTE